MRAVAQRVTQASVTVDGQVIGAIDEPGLLVFVGVTHDDTADKAKKLAAKLWGLRILDGGEVLLGPGGAAARGEPVHPLRGHRQGQAANLEQRRPRAGRRAAGRPPSSTSCARLGARVETGEFGADMKVALVNDGPVTIIVEL